MYRVLDTKDYTKLMKQYNITSLAAKVLAIRQITFTSKIEEKNSYNYKDMDKVVGMILKAINDHKKIAVYGDYDVDGICSVSILYRTFKLLNYNIGYYIPNRYEDGYGLSSKIVKQMKDKGYSLLICVDNGIKAFEAIEEARKLDMDVIVLDHHQKEELLPNFNLYLHPEYSNFSEYNMCGASICYYLSNALLAKEDEKCAMLAGIATIGDVMPLVDQNKLLVSKAIKYLNEKHYNAIDLLNTGSKKYDENLISMVIVPKLNSIGRICKGTVANQLVKFLTSDNEQELRSISKFIENTNNERKTITEENFVKLDKESYDSKIIIEKSDDMLEGINGIIAARFVTKYKLPSIVFSLDDKKENYKGSARSISGLNIIEILKDNNYIEAYGGHKAAAGLTVKKENFANFVKHIESQCENYVYEEEIIDVIEIDENEISYKSYQDLSKLAPFGEGNTKPLFLLKNIKDSNINKSKDGKHVLLNISKDVSLVGFGLANKLEDKYGSYNFIFKLELNNMYPNKITCMCIDLEGNNNV